MSDIFFSVVIPTYNRADRLAVALESLVEQTYKNFEVLVCDDGSTDNSKEVTESFSNKLDIKYFWEENWGGPARPRNLGIKNSKYEWICFLDSDDWWSPTKLERCLIYIDDFDVIFHDLVVFKNNKEIDSLIKGRELNADYLFLDLILNRNAIPNSSAVVKKSCLVKVGFISEDKDLVAIEDYDLWIRIALNKYRFKYIDESLGYYFIGGENLTKSAIKRNLLEMRIYERYKNLIPKKKKAKVLSNLYSIIAINYIQANDIRYIKAALLIFIYGNFKVKLWALKVLISGKSYVKNVVKPII